MAAHVPLRDNTLKALAEQEYHNTLHTSPTLPPPLIACQGKVALTVKPPHSEEKDRDKEERRMNNNSVKAGTATEES